MAWTSIHEWIGIVPGDMHAKGYFCEACFKEQGPGGFHFIVNTVMRRPKLFVKKRKFKTGNLLRIKEAVYDCTRAHGLAAVTESSSSEYYPDANARLTSLKKNGNHNDVMYEAFQNWVQHGCKVPLTRLVLKHATVILLCSYRTKERSLTASECV